MWRGGRGTRWAVSIWPGRVNQYMGSVLLWTREPFLSVGRRGILESLVVHHVMIVYERQDRREYYYYLSLLLSHSSRWLRTDVISDRSWSGGGSAPSGGMRRKKSCIGFQEKRI